MSVMNKIRVFLEDLSSGSIFPTQGLIHLGTRSAVDTALSRLNKEGLIQRLAWGVYLNTPDRKAYPNEYIQTSLVKAQAFGRKILPHGELIANLLGFPQEKLEDAGEANEREANEGEGDCREECSNAFVTFEECESDKSFKTDEKPLKIKVVKFFTNGSAANFRILRTNIRVKFIPLSPKKFRNYLLEGGYWINAVRTMGWKYFKAYETKLKEKLPPFRSALQSLKESFELMPGWLYAALKTRYANRYNQRKHALIELPQLMEPVPGEHLQLIWGPGFDWRSRV